MEELILEEARSFYSEEEELIIEEEALFLNREMLTEIKNLIDDINDTKSSHLKQFIHPQWGSILGSEEDIRLAVLQDEVELCEQRVENDSDSIPHLGYMLFALKSRIKELKPPNPPVNTIQEHEMTWGKEYE